MKKTGVWILAAALLLSLAGSAMAGGEVGAYSYDDEASGITYLATASGGDPEDCRWKASQWDGTKKYVVIPAKINGWPVTGAEDGLFSDGNLEAVLLEHTLDDMRKIADGSFAALKGDFPIFLTFSVEEDKIHEKLGVNPDQLREFAPLTDKILMAVGEYKENTGTLYIYFNDLSESAWYRVRYTGSDGVEEEFRSESDADLTAFQIGNGTVIFQTTDVELTEQARVLECTVEAVDWFGRTSKKTTVKISLPAAPGEEGGGNGEGSGNVPGSGNGNTPGSGNGNVSEGGSVTPGVQENTDWTAPEAAAPVVPETGDEAPLALWAALTLLGAAAAVGMGRRRKAE